MKKTKITSCLRLHFELNKSRIDCLVLFIIGMIKSQSVNLSNIAKFIGYDNSDSAYKRFKRFIREIHLPKDRLAYFIERIVWSNQKKSMTLIFDRTNWKFGKNHINILFLSVCAQGISIPLFFTFLKGKKSGNSNQQDRIDLIEKFIKTFGKKRIKVILGDREFIGYKWLGYLIKEKIPFCFRLKEGWQLVSGRTGNMIPVKKCFKGLKRGCVKRLGVRQLGAGKKCVHCNITGMRNKTGEWIILAHSSDLDNPCDLYRDRWQIESLFRAMKTGGFQLESTHITDPQRLECLIGVVCMSYAICYKSGEIVVKKKEPKLKKHGYRDKSIFRYGFDKITQILDQLYLKARKARSFFTELFKPLRLSKKIFVP